MKRVSTAQDSGAPMRHRRGFGGFKLILIIALCAAIGACGALLTHRLNVDSQTTAFELKNIGELATQAGYFTVVNTMDDSVKLWGWSVPFTDSHYVYSYDGVVKAGLDFSELDFTVDKINMVVNVSLPEIKLLSVEVDEDSLKIYDERQNIYSPLELDDVKQARTAMIEEVRQKAIDNGLLEQAEENAKTLIKGFLSGEYDPEKYEYVFSGKAGE